VGSLPVPGATPDPRTTYVSTGAGFRKGGTERLQCGESAPKRRGGGVCTFSRALVAYEPTLRAALKPGGFLTRDPRSVERKKYGKPKARKSFQFSKR